MHTQLRTEISEQVVEIDISEVSLNTASFLHRNVNFNFNYVMNNSYTVSI